MDGDAFENQWEASHLAKTAAKTRNPTDCGCFGLQRLILLTSHFCSQKYFHLPDGARKGIGYPDNGDQSMVQLMLGNISRITDRYGRESYTANELVATLRSLLNTALPERLLTLDHLAYDVRDYLLIVL